MEQLLQQLSGNPLVAFTVLLLVVLIIPPIFERRLRLPGLIGLLIAGVILGPDVLGILDGKSEAMVLLADIGKIYLMFVAGLEIDLADFRRTKERSLGFGLATFLVPMIMGCLVGRTFGFGWNASILIGSLLASHTLLGYPIVQRLGLVKNEAVTVTIGATIFTDIGALLVLAICIAIHGGSFTPQFLVLQLFLLAVYAMLVLFGVDWAGKQYFRRTGDDQGNQFLFVLLVVFLASVGAQAINVDKIVGAFLAGLAINDVVGHGPVEEKVVFVGSTLFIPFFFVSMGLLLELPGLTLALSSGIGLTLAIVLGLISSKFLAAIVVKGLYKYQWSEAITMWSLSMPQVAATLAATLAGVSAGLLTDAVFNAVIVMMVVTSILGPLLTDRFARQLPPLPLSLAETTFEDLDYFAATFTTSGNIKADHFAVVVPVANPHTENALLEVGAMLAQAEGGRVIPLAIAKAHAHMDDPDLSGALQYSRQLLQTAVGVGQHYDIPLNPVVRIDDDVADGITRTAREQNASLIVMGWSPITSLRARLFGNLIDSVVWSAHCPVAVVKLLTQPVHIQRILVPVKAITPQALSTVRFAMLFAQTYQATVTLLYVESGLLLSGNPTSFEVEKAAEFKHLIAEATQQFPDAKAPSLEMVANNDVAQAIRSAALNVDLVILRTMRRRSAGGLAVSDVTTQVLQYLSCSVILFGEPHT